MTTNRVINRLFHHTTILINSNKSTSLSVTHRRTKSNNYSILSSIMGNTTSSSDNNSSQYKPEYGTLYDLSARDIDGNDVQLSKYRGTPLMIVNVASACGKTDNEYKRLVELYNKYHSQNFEILAFPCNQFLFQESGSCQSIKQFIQKYNVTFPMFDKINVNGDNTHPVYKFCKQAFPGRVTWNFSGKFFIDKNGVPVARANDNWDEIEQIVQKLTESKQ